MVKRKLTKKHTKKRRGGNIFTDGADAMRRQTDDMLARLDEQAKARARGAAYNPNFSAQNMMNQGYSPEMAMLLGKGYNPYHTGAGKRKHTKVHKKRGGYKANVLGVEFDIPIKSEMSKLIQNNSLVKQYAPIIAEIVPPDYLPSKMLEKLDVTEFISKDAFGGYAQPIAIEMQEGVVDGLQKSGVGRRRRVGRPSLQSKKARARHVSAAKRNAKFAHKKINRKRHSKPKK